MNRQSVAAIAQAVQYRLETLWLEEPKNRCPYPDYWTVIREGIMGAKLAALETIYSFNDPAMCPDDWETYG